MISKKTVCLLLCAVLLLSISFTGCKNNAEKSGVTEIELVQYKPEAVDIFEQFEEEFNATHSDIHLKISSPNDAITILKTRFIREDYPDIIGIGGEVHFSNFVDSELLADVSDFEEISNIKQGYLDILDSLEFVPTEGIYGVPYMANAAGVLYNRDMFEEHGWSIPKTWDEFIALCEQIKSEGITPLYFGYKDTWTTLAPWNALAIELSPSDICQQVNAGKATFADNYGVVADKMLQLLEYGEKDPFAYGYNDACTAFARGESAMYTIGSYAVPQITSVNPEMNIDSFVMPGCDKEEDQILNSGVDLMFSVMDSCENKEAAYEVISFLLEKENVQKYIDAQNAVPCMVGDYKLSPMLDGMEYYITNGIIADFQDHQYPSEMAVDAQIQTMLINKDKDAFLTKFDTDWVRYNRDIIRKIQQYYENK